MCVRGVQRHTYNHCALLGIYARATDKNLTVALTIELSELGFFWEPAPESPAALMPARRHRKWCERTRKCGKEQPVPRHQAGKVSVRGKWTANLPVQEMQDVCGRASKPSLTTGPSRMCVTLMPLSQMHWTHSTPGLSPRTSSLCERPRPWQMTICCPYLQPAWERLARDNPR